MHLPPWLHNLSAARRREADRKRWKSERAGHWPALRSMELEERRVLAVTSITAAADIMDVPEGQTLTNVTVATFQDPDALNTHTAAIDWGDGTITAGTIQDDGGGQYSVLGSHTYGDNADYMVEITVTGQENVPFMTDMTIGVDNVDPGLTVPADNSIVANEGDLVSISDIGVFTDPGFLDTHTATINWGDGTAVEAGTVTEVNGSGKVAGSHIYGDNGTFTVKVTVTDDDGGSTTEEFDLIVNNVDPSLTVPADNSIVVDEGELVTISDLGIFTDPGFLDTHTATIDWGDGTPVEAGTVTEANGSGKVSGSHIYGDNGTFTVKVTVTDDDGGSTTEKFDLIVNNVDPSLTVPADNSIVVDEGDLVTINNLGVFTDPGFLDTHTATVDWGDGTPVEAGTVAEFNGSGKVSGSHIYGDNGTFTVKVTVTDDDGGSTTEEFTILVNNVAPTLTVPADNSIIADEGDLITINDLGVFTDPGFLDTHTATIDWGDGTPVEAGIVTEVNGSGKIAGSHIYGDNGTFTVKVTVTDDDGGTTTEEFTILVNNIDPTLTVPADNSIIADEGDLVTVNDLGVFTDPGFLDTHTATVDWGDGTPVEAGLVTEVNGSGKIEGSHIYGDNGVFTVKVTVTDDDGGTTTEEFTILVNNVAPTLTPTVDQTVLAGAPLILPVAGNFTDPGFLDTHTAEVNWGDGSPTESATVAQGAGFGSVMAGHVFTAPGVYTVTLTLTDDDGGVDVQTFLVTVDPIILPPDPPIILPPGQLGDPATSDPALTAGNANTSFLGGGDESSVLTLYQPIDGGEDLASTNANRDESSTTVAPSATEKRFILVIVYADGTESEPVTLPDSDVSNLPGLWRRLPDNFYRVYQVQENGSLRLVTQGYVQNGILVDPNDKNETQDRPPTSQKDFQPDAAQVTQTTVDDGPYEVALARLSLPDVAEAQHTLTPDDAPAELAAGMASSTEASATFPDNQSTLKELPADDALTAKSPSSSALLATAVAAGVVVRRQSTQNWEQTVDQALERLPEDWSKTKALWRTRKPR